MGEDARMKAVLTVTSRSPTTRPVESYGRKRIAEFDAAEAELGKVLRGWKSARRGVTRFEVLGLDGDRQLIRLLAKRLAENDPAARHLRTALKRALSGAPAKKGGILAALRRSPLVGVTLDVTRETARRRQGDL